MAGDRDRGDREDRRLFRRLGASYAALVVGGMVAILIAAIVLIVIAAD